MRAARPDYAKMLQITADGKLKALLRHVQDHGAVELPVAIGVLAPTLRRQDRQ